MTGTEQLVVPRRCGAIGAWLLAAVFVNLWIMVLGVLPRHAYLTMGTLERLYWDPAVFFSFLREHGLLWRLFEPDIVVSPAIFLVSWGTGRVLQDRASSLSRLATLAGAIGAALFLALAMIEGVALPRLAKVFTSNPEAAGAAFHGVQAIFWALARGAMFATGWWALLCSLAGWRGKQLPRVLCCLGIVTGISLILVFAIPALEVVAPIVGLLWLPWLGIALIRKG